MSTDTMESPIGTDRRLAPALRALLLEALAARELLGARRANGPEVDGLDPDVGDDIEAVHAAERAFDAETALATYLGARILS